MHTLLALLLKTQPKKTSSFCWLYICMYVCMYVLKACKGFRTSIALYLKLSAEKKKEN